MIKKSKQKNLDYQTKPNQTKPKNKQTKKLTKANPTQDKTKQKLNQTKPNPNQRLLDNTHRGSVQFSGPAPSVL